MAGKRTRINLVMATYVIGNVLIFSVNTLGVGTSTGLVLCPSKSTIRDLCMTCDFVLH